MACTFWKVKPTLRIHRVIFTNFKKHSNVYVNVLYKFLNPMKVLQTLLFCKTQNSGNYWNFDTERPLKSLLTQELQSFILKNPLTPHWWNLEQSHTCTQRRLWKAFPIQTHHLSKATSSPASPSPPLLLWWPSPTLNPHLPVSHHWGTNTREDL